MKKSQLIFLTPIASKKTKFVKFGVKKQSGNPGYEACERIFRSLVFIA